MSAVTIYREFRRLQRSQWHNESRLRERRQRKFLELIRHAYETVPFYRQSFERAGVVPDAIKGLEDLHRLPVLSKRDVQAAGLEAMTSTAFPSADLLSTRTTGSTGRPLTVRLDRHWISVQKALFLRALAAAGYRPGDRMMILTEDIESRSTPRWLRWSYFPYNEAPDRLLHSFNSLRPKLLYGWVTPLRRLALYARDNAKDLHRPRSVITTAEALDPMTRQLLREVFGTEPYEFYGLTETGSAAWECASHDGFHLSEDSLITEFPDAAGGSRASRLIVTNLELKAMPFIRYETGDVVTLKPDVPCQCGRPSRRIAQVEGRSVDCVRLGDGRLVLPYDFTFVLKQIEGLNRYQVVHEDLDAFKVRYEGPSAGEDNRAKEIRMAIAGLVGPDAQVQVCRVDNLDPPAGQKFRIVESKLAAPNQEGLGSRIPVAVEDHIK